MGAPLNTETAGSVCIKSREAAHRFLELDGKFLKSGASLLGEIRERISPGWFKAAARVIYNSGGRIEPQPAGA